MSELHGFEPSANCQSCRLRKPDFFCHFNGIALKHFDRIKSLSLYPSGTVIFLEGDKPRGIFVLCEGQIKLSIGSREGKNLILQIATPGQVLGLTAVVEGVPYEATAETLRPSQIAFVRRDDFLKFARQYPDIHRNFWRTTVVSYKAVCEQIRTVGLSSTQKRLAKLLLDWSEGAGHPLSQIVMPLTHEEIGEFIGTTRETVTRTLGDLRGRRLIAMKGAAVTIRDRKALEQIAAA